MRREHLDRKISQLYSLRQQKKILLERIGKLSEQIKKEIGSDTYLTGCSNLLAYVEPRHKITNREQCEIDQLFHDKNLFGLYAELTIPDLAIDLAHDAGDISDEELEWLRELDTTSALKIERKSDVQSEDELHS